MTTLTAATPTTRGGLLPGGPAVRPSSAGAAGLTGADVIRILRQRLVLISFLWLFSVGVTVGATALMVKYYPKYSADALILVESTEPPDPDNMMGSRMPRSDEVERILQNQALLCESKKVLQDAIEDADLRGTQWYREAVESKDNPRDVLEDTIVAVPIRDSNYLRVAASWKFPKEVPIIVNTVVDKYIAQMNSVQKDSFRDINDQLTEQAADAERQYQAQQDEINALIESADFAVGTTNPGPSERLLTLQALVTELDVELVGRKALWEQLQSIRPEEVPITADLQALLDSDPTIVRLQASVEDVEQSLRVSLERFGENHSVVKQLRASRDSIADRLSEERAVKIIRYQNEQIDQARRGFLEAQDQLLKLKDKLAEAQSEQRDRDRKYNNYLRLLEKRDQLKLQLENLNDQKATAARVLGGRRITQIEVRARAVEPLRRSSPSWFVWIPGGSFLGLALSVGVAFLLEIADKTVRTPRDISPISVLGMIPTSDDDEIEIERPETACVDAPHSIVAEAFRTLRANLFFSAPAEQQGVLLVTSPSGANGKTTVATNLAISIALSGRRVLLIDANFRRAALPRLFSNMNEDGLSNILIGQGRLADLATATTVPGLDVLSAGPIPPNPAELLGGSYLRDLVVDARSQYDQVIVDGPPVLLVSDAMVLAGAVDGVLMVCQYRSTSRGALQRARSQLDAMNARIFGAVMNQVQTRAGGYFRKAYREFYEYHEIDEEEEGIPPRRRLDLHVAGAAAEAAAPPEDMPPSLGEAANTDTPTVRPKPPKGGAPAIDDSFDDEGLSSAKALAEAPDLDLPSAPVVTMPDFGELPLAEPEAFEADVKATPVGEPEIPLAEPELGGEDSPAYDAGQVESGDPIISDELDQALPDIDKEIESIRDADALDDDISLGDEFGLEDLDFESDGPDQDEEEGGRPGKD